MLWLEPAVRLALLVEHRVSVIAVKGFKPRTGHFFLLLGYLSTIKPETMLKYIIRYISYISKVKH